MTKRFQGFFIFTTAVILFITALAKITAMVGTATTLDAPDPLLHIQSRSVLWLMSVLEVVVSAILLVGRSGKAKLLLIIGLTACWLGYSLCLPGAQSICNCFGIFNRALPIPPRILFYSSIIILCYMILGGLISWALRAGCNPVNARLEQIRAPGDSQSETENIERTPDHRPLKSLITGWGTGALLLIGVITGLRLHSKAALPKNIDAMLNEAYFHGEILIAPIVNNRGDALLYVRTIESGIGIFMVDLKTLRRVQIARAQAANESRSGAVKLYGWSKDDRILAFSTIVKGDENHHVIICDGQTAAPMTAFDAPHSISMGSWLTTNSLFFLDDSHALFLFNIERNNSLGPFGAKGLVKLHQLDESGNCPVPDSDNSIAFIERGNLWRLNISNDRVLQLTQLTNASLDRLDYNPTSEKYLFEFKDYNSTNRLLCQYDPSEDAAHNITAMTGDHSMYAVKGQWIGNGSGIAYIASDGERNFISVETGDAGLKTNLFATPSRNRNARFGPGTLSQYLFAEGMKVVRNFSVNANRDKIYAVASVSWEPLAIYEYDINTKILRNVVPERETSQFARPILPVQRLATNQDGRAIDYYFLPPCELNQGKKYPVLLDQFSDLGFQPNSQFLANAGMFFVTVNRYGVGRGEAPAEPKDAMAVYYEILKNPNVDAHRIYLFGESAGTTTIATLITEHPELWRGAIMLSPTAFPNFQSRPESFPSIFLSLGENDTAAGRKAAELFAQEAYSHLVRTEIHYGKAGHVFYNVDELKKRYKAIAEFVLANH